MAQEQGHRWFAAFYDRLTGPCERRVIGPIRKKLLSGLRGQVLEIGVGTGASFTSYEPAAATVVATEPDPHMLEHARARLAGLVGTTIELRQASADALPFDDSSFDHVVSGLVLCTVPDVTRTLADIGRVLKAGGTLVFIEHVRNDDSWLVGRLQDAIRPAWGWCAAGCNPNRRTVQAIGDAGFSIEALERFELGPGWYGYAGVAMAA